MTHHVDADEAAFAAEFPRAYAAMGYAQRGWHVLPVHWMTGHGRCTCLAGGQAACASGGKHPYRGNWPETATADPGEVVRIWGEIPEANLGIATGNTSGIWVLDVDEGIRKDGTYKAGLESLIDLIDAYEELPDTYAVRTGGGGIQYYFAMPTGYRIKSVSRSAGNEPALGPDYPDIDLRGDGGMVVAPPSVSCRGPYTVETGGDVADTPQWLIDLLLQRGVMEPLEAPRDPMPETAQEPVPETAPVRSDPPGWLEASLATKLRAVRDAPDGMGNETINSVSFQIGQYIPNGWITREDAERRLREAAASWEHPHPRAEFTIAHGLTDGMRRPYQTLANAASAGDTSDAIMSGRVAAELLAGSFCWASGLDWLSWTGNVWRREDSDVRVTEAIRNYMITEVRSSIRQVADNATARKALMGLLSKSRITAIMTLTRGIVQVDPTVFDAHPDLLNTPGGVVDLRTGEVSEPDPELYFMKITDVAYRKDAEHEDWNKALEAIPETCRAWFQTRVGQAATGHTPPDDSMVLLQGGGENGKTTVLIALMKALGAYHVLVPNSAMTGKNEDPHALMPFMGARLAIVEELPEGRRLNVVRLKETVGTPRMTGRHMYKDPITWDASHTLMITTNYIPTVNETDRGTWRRLKMLRFPFTFVRKGKPLNGPLEKRGDAQLRFRLINGREQKEAALAWAVEGAKAWYAAERVMPEDPERVETDTDAWRMDADLVLGYWRTQIEVSPGSHVIATDLLNDFNLWLKRTGHSVEWTSKLIGMRFGTHEETIKNKVVRQQISAREGLSRPPLHGDLDVPARYMAYVGVRFHREA
jgi:P4 family phage/plasmid primase-like protien